MSKFTFNFFNDNEGAVVTTTKETSVRKPTQGQMKYYLDLCEQKRVTPQSAEEFTFDTISEEIKRLLKYYPASEKQIELIGEKLDNIDKLVSVLKFKPEQIEQFKAEEDNIICHIILSMIEGSLVIDDITKDLTGGREGTASKLIEGLIAIEKQFNNTKPPTDNQLELIVSMFLCPDVGFEDYDISRTIMIDEELWRKPSPEEFSDIVKDKMTSQIASEFIDKYRGAFHEWKKTRIRPEQMRYIMKLEGYMGNDNSPGVVEFATTLEGDVIEITPSKKEYIGGECFTPHTEEQLIQFSIEQASEYIDQLKAELDRKEESSLVDDIIFFNERNMDEEEYILEEYKEFESLMFKLEDIAGYNDDELHQAATIHLVQDNSPESNVENRKKIRDFMRDLLETNSITLYELVELTKECPTAQRILLDV